MNSLILLFLSSLIACDRGEPTPESPGEPATEDPPAKSFTSKLNPFASDQDCSDTSGADVEPQDGCFSGTLTCGKTILGHTRNGGSRWEGLFYQKKFCEAMVDPYPGEERVYRFSMPKQHLATIELTSDCEDLDLFVLQWSEDTCPTLNQMINTCDVDISRKGGEVLVEAIQYPRNFLIIVEGKGGVDAPFELSATCRSRSG